MIFPFQELTHAKLLGKSGVNGHTVEENKGFRSHLRLTKTPYFVNVYRGISPMNRVFFPTSKRHGLVSKRPDFAERIALERHADVKICSRLR
jgi:hypothetical protein